MSGGIRDRQTDRRMQLWAPLGGEIFQRLKTPVRIVADRVIRLVDVDLRVVRDRHQPDTQHGVLLSCKPLWPDFRYRPASELFADRHIADRNGLVDGGSSLWRSRIATVSHRSGLAEARVLRTLEKTAST